MPPASHCWNWYLSCHDTGFGQISTNICEWNRRITTASWTDTSLFSASRVRLLMAVFNPEETTSSEDSHCNYRSHYLENITRHGIILFFIVLNICYSTQNKTLPRLDLHVRSILSESIWLEERKNEEVNGTILDILFFFHLLCLKCMCIWLAAKMLANETFAPFVFGQLFWQKNEVISRCAAQQYWRNADD